MCEPIDDKTEVARANERFLAEWCREGGPGMLEARRVLSWVPSVSFSPEDAGQEAALRRHKTYGDGRTALTGALASTTLRNVICEWARARKHRQLPPLPGGGGGGGDQEETEAASAAAVAPA